jgi:penicillin amidase
MSTAQVAPARRYPWRTILARAFGGLLLLLLAIFLTVAGWFYFAARAALPEVDGAIRVAGVAAPVTVTRDIHGVPHIRARGIDDALFAQGYVTAQDRLWQMDMTRRWAAGEMSEILGPTWLAHDRQQRILSLRQVAEGSAARFSPADRKGLQAYVDGVNAFIAGHRDHLPMEFRLLHYQPKLWTPADSILVGAGMAQTLTFSVFQSQLKREQITRKLGAGLAAWLFPNQSWRDRPPSASASRAAGSPAADDSEEDDEDQDRAALRPAESSGAAVIAQTPEPFSEDYAQVPGSNNWVVSGAHTVSGKPLLSNDMHLRHQIPNVWYEAHLAAPGLDVGGVTLPGMPYIVVGHNRRIAWGFTNLGPDVQDIYIESFDRDWHDGASQYRTPQGWQRPERRQEVIRVLGGDDVKMEVVSTRHGPIVTELANAPAEPTASAPSASAHSTSTQAIKPAGEERALALRWTVYQTGLDFPFGELNAASNWEEFRHAMRRLAAPAQNTVYADVDGHIGYQATGSIPIRRYGDGSVPVPGDDDAHEWTGYVAFDKLPRVYDPPSGILATANGRITPNGYPFALSSQWGSPYRTERIYRVLESGAKFSREDMLALQNDIYSDFDQLCAGRMVAAVDADSKSSARAREAADLLRSWDGRMSQDSAAATIVLVARSYLWNMLLTAKGIDPKDYTWYSSSVAMENFLTRQPKEWLPPGYSTYDQLLTAAVEAAVREQPGRGWLGRLSFSSNHNSQTSNSQTGNSQTGNSRTNSVSPVPWVETASSPPAAKRKLNRWTRGRQFPLVLQHPIFGALPILNRWSGPGTVPQSGGAYTVKQVGTTFGPSERMTVDFADLDESTLNIVTGQSGEIFSPYYNDQWRAWYEGTSFALPFSPAAVEKLRAHELRLEPRR